MKGKWKKKLGESKQVPHDDCAMTYFRTKRMGIFTLPTRLRKNSPEQIVQNLKKNPHFETHYVHMTSFPTSPFE